MVHIFNNDYFTNEWITSNTNSHEQQEKHDANKDKCPQNEDHGEKDVGRACIVLSIRHEARICMNEEHQTRRIQKPVQDYLKNNVIMFFSSW